MTNAEVTLLGLLNESPCYGYELEKIITERSMRDWTEIGFSSIYYILHKLEKKELIVKKAETKKLGPARKVFSITASGNQALQAALRRIFTFPRQPIYDFDLALSFKDALDQGEITDNMHIYQALLAKKIRKATEKWEAMGGISLPLAQQLYFSRTLKLLEAELAWAHDAEEMLQ